MRLFTAILLFSTLSCAPVLTSNEPFIIDYIESTKSGLCSYRDCKGKDVDFFCTFLITDCGYKIGDTIKICTP